MSEGMNPMQMREYAEGLLYGYRARTERLRAYLDGGAQRTLPAPHTGRLLGGLTADERERLYAGQNAVEAALVLLETVYPIKARFMRRLYGLDAPFNRTRQERARIFDAALALNASEATLYRWREDILQFVIVACIEAGLLTPTGVGGRISTQRDAV